MLFAPDARFGYEAFFSPLPFGALTAIPSLVGYSKKELSIRRALHRKIWHVLLLETIFMSVLWTNGLLTDIPMTVSLGLTILVIDVTVNLVLWMNDKKTADRLTLALKKMQETCDGPQGPHASRIRFSPAISPCRPERIEAVHAFTP